MNAPVLLAYSLAKQSHRLRQQATQSDAASQSETKSARNIYRHQQTPLASLMLLHFVRPAGGHL